MVGKDLNTQLVEAGRALVESLDAAGWSPDAAMWFYFAENDHWRFVLGEPRMLKKGPKLAYRELQKAIGSKGLSKLITLSDVILVPPDHRVLATVRKLMRTSGDAIVDARIQKTVVDGMLIDEALVYRMR